MVLAQITLDTSETLKEFKLKDLREVNTYQRHDNLEGVLVKFTALSGKDASTIEVESMAQPRSLSATVGEPPLLISVGTEYDPKEILFRNVVGVMGPASDPAVLIQSDERDRKSLYNVVFFDPAGNIAAVEQVALESGTRYPDETVQPNLPKPLRPGTWTVAVIERGFDEALFHRQFLVLPLVQDGSVPDLPDPPGDWVHSDHHRHLVLQNLKAEAEADQRRTGADLFDWAAELASRFYAISDECVVSAGEGLGPKCEDVAWSSVSSDPKSELRGVDPKTGRLMGR